MCLFIYRAIRYWFIWLWGAWAGRGWKKPRKKTNNVRNVLSWLCVLFLFFFFKERSPSASSRSCEKHSAHKRSWAADPLVQPQDRHWVFQVEHYFLGRSPCLGGHGKASLNHLEPQFPYLLKENKSTTDLFMLFWRLDEIQWEERI